MIRFRIAIGIIFVLLFIGTFGYVIIENFTMLEGFYMTVITLSTVGFKEVRNLSQTGQVFTTILILAGVGTLAYSVSQATQILLESRVFKRTRREGQVLKMKNHVIICGFGRIGQRVARRLRAGAIDFVIIEKNPDVSEKLEECGYLYIDGDAREDETLLKAGIKQAKSIVATLSSDADNVYVILSARNLNPDLHIVARAGLPESAVKLSQAGANRVVSPYEIGSNYIANAVLRPNVVDFMDVVAKTRTDEVTNLEIEEIAIPVDSPFADKPLRETNIRSERNIIVLAIKDSSGRIVYNPSSDHRIQPGGTLICIGFLDQLDILAREVLTKRFRA